jgi:HPt (histidine-containing phosphotransfer) domain-containing protein
MMPGMDGVETTKELRRLGYTSPIVALSANAVVGQADMFLNNGFDDFVSKPIDVRRLNTVLNKYVRDSQRREQSTNPEQAVNPEQVAQIADSAVSGMYQNCKCVAGIDVDKGLEKFSGDTQIYHKILRSYTASMREIIAELEQTNANETLSDESRIVYQRNVHSIKGTSRDIFADEIGEDAANLEKAAKEGDFAFIGANSPAFLEKLKTFISDLESWLNSAEPVAPKTAKNHIDSAILEKLLNACKTYDMDGADEAMAELDEFEYESAESTALMQWLHEKSNLMKFNEIVGRLSSELAEKITEGV